MEAQQVTMKTGKWDVNRQQWNDQQAILRRWLMKDQDYQKALPIFLSQHAMLHTAQLDARVHWSCQDEVLSGLTPSKCALCPKAALIPSPGRSGTLRDVRTSR